MTASTFSDAGVWAGLANPPVMFFFLGVVAALTRSSLRVPGPVTRLLSLYLLWAIGFSGGVKLAAPGALDQEALVALGAAMLLAVATPLWSYVVLRRLVGPEDAAALAAAYGSISAVTFMAASTVLQARGIEFGGHMVAAMALMESPAIIVAVLLLRVSGRSGWAGGSGPRPGAGKMIHEALFNGPVLLLMGSMIIGVITGERGYAMFKPLCTDLFSGVLVFFLLDLGIRAARRLKDLRRAGWGLVAFGLVAPPVHAGLALGLARLCGLSVGDGVLLMVLGASASYIAVPAAVRLVIPQANPGLYIPLPLAVTFPLNVAVGIPAYIWAAERVLG
jgi:hypothetical protein